MQLTFLGTGTSGGVPSIGCKCKVCHSNDPRDKRLRCSSLLEEGNTRILIDCGPDFRQQILPWDFRKMDGVLLTHIHYDHVAGLDDIRPFCVFGAVPVYADEKTARGLHHTMPYCFAEHPYPGVPLLELHVVEPNIPFVIGGIEVMPIQVMHGKLPILGFRFGKLAYITDMKTIAPDQLLYLEGVETLVVNALRIKKEHHSHQLLQDAVAFAQQLGAKTTYLIHLTHDIGLHEETEKMLPENIHLAYDNLTITV